MISRLISRLFGGPESGPGIDCLGDCKVSKYRVEYHIEYILIWFLHPLALSSGSISRSIDSLNRLLGALAQYSNVAGDWLRGAESGPGINCLGSARLANIGLNIILNVYLYDSSIIALVLTPTTASE